MPNHIQNRLKIIGTPERVEEILTAIHGNVEWQRIDFDKIIPCPEPIKNVGDRVSLSVADAVKIRYNTPLDSNPLLARLELMNRSSNVLRPEDEGVFLKACKAFEETGYIYWYDWNCGNWGTKWNAYEQEDDRNTKDTIFFNTAWNTPIPVFKKLAELFPDVQIEIAYADEDSGSNTGRIICKDGLMYHSENESQSIKAYELYFELHPDNREDYVLVDGKYEYKED